MNNFITEAEKMRSVKIEDVDKNELVDIKDIKIDLNQPQSERLRNFISQIKNPYCFKCGELVVKVKFADTDKTFAERLGEYLSSVE